MNRALIVVPLLLLASGGLFLVLRPDSVGGSRERALDVGIEEGVMDPEEVTVGEGDRVTMRITSGTPVEFHLHGYDLFAEVEPGETAELSFDATITGRFEIEDHGAGHEVLGVLLVQPR